jgi:CBS-domain-containing membrane protein
VFRKSLTRLSPDKSIEEGLRSMNRDRTKTAAVVDENDRLLGIVNRHKFFKFPEEYRKSVKLGSVMVKDPFFAYITDSLHNALVRLSSNELKEMPVLSNEDNRVLGIVTISDLVILYDKEVEKVMKIKKDNHYTFSSVVDDDTSSVDTNPNKNLKKL